MLRLELIIGTGEWCSNFHNILDHYWVELFLVPLRSGWNILSSWTPLISRQLVHQMGLGHWQSNAEGWLGKDSGRAHTWWPVKFCHLPLCAFLFSMNQPPHPSCSASEAPQVACNVWWWKASVMDLFYIQAHLNWCDSSSLSPDQALYCLCLGVNAFWMDEFHYRAFCVCACSLSTWIRLHVWPLPRWAAECVHSVNIDPSMWRWQFHVEWK